MDILNHKVCVWQCIIVGAALYVFTTFAARIHDKEVVREKVDSIDKPKRQDRNIDGNIESFEEKSDPEPLAVEIFTHNNDVKDECCLQSDSFEVDPIVKGLLLST